MATMTADDRRLLADIAKGRPPNDVRTITGPSGGETFEVSGDVLTLADAVPTLLAEVEQLCAEQDRIWPDLCLALELLDTAFDMGSVDLYGAQGVNQAHRIIRALVAGEEPMRPRKVVLTPPAFVTESDF
jgi:hypothetical protein